MLMGKYVHNPEHKFRTLGQNASTANLSQRGFCGCACALLSCFRLQRGQRF